jgi:RHS repeat-associated protein
MHRNTLSVAQKCVCAFLVALQPFVSLPAWAVAGPTITPNPHDEAKQIQAALPVPNLSSVAPLLPRFSDPPQEDEFARVLLLPYPLVPVAPSTAEENRALAKALQRQGCAQPDNLEALIGFLDQRPHSVWRASLLCNLGRLLLQQGRFSRAIGAWDEAWRLTKSATNESPRFVADQALTELAQIQAWMGATDKFDALLADAGDRPVLGGGWEKIQSARRARWTQAGGANSGLNGCGPAAIDSILRELGGKPLARPLSGPRKNQPNLSLAELKELASQAGLDYVAVKRTSKSPPPPPRSIIHWRQNHYSALLDKQGGNWIAGDPNFKQFYGRQLRLSPQALDEDASGYFLIPSDQVRQGWERVDSAEARQIVGAMRWLKSDTQALAPNDAKDPCATNKNEHGMAQYGAHLMLVSLNIVDVPVGYAPPIGPAVFFRATYNQRDEESQATPAYSNLGPQWTFDWSTYIEEENGQSADLTRYVSGGGVMVYRKNATVAGWQPDLDGNQIAKVEGGYELSAPDGSKLVFGQQVGTSPVRFFLTSFTDSTGIGVVVSYDTSGRISTITDAVGRNTVFSYGLSGPNNLMYKITSVRDPFGREAKMTYDSLGRLKTITDPVGITSAFAYEHLVNRNFITSMATPYGVSRFTYGENTTTAERWLIMADPAGGKEKIHYVDNMYSGVDQAPSIEGFRPADQARTNNVRNTFYLSKAALDGNEDRTDYANCAYVFHWMPREVNDPAPSRILESVKPPRESRVWLYYPGQFQANAQDQYQYAASFVSLRKPNLIARLVEGPGVPSPVTQTNSLEYNNLGHVTSYTDPKGRKTRVTYYSNGIDINQIRQVDGSNEYLLASFGTYNTQHRPESFVNAGGGIYGLVWNNKGQLQRITPPTGMGLATELYYDTNSSWNLQCIQRYGGGMKTSFTYDNTNRVRTVTDPNLYAVSYFYDNLDRLTQVVFPDTSNERFEYNRLDLVRAYDRAGSRTDYTYDAIGRPLTVRDRDRRETAFEWCGCGGLGSIRDANGHTTTWVYNEGRLVSKNFNNNSKIEYTYEPLSGRLATVKDARNQIKTYRYNVDDTLYKVLYSAVLMATPDVEFAYDAVYPRLTMASTITSTPEWSATFVYHPINQPPQLGAGQLASETTSVSSLAIDYAYDLMGRRTTRTAAGADDALVYDNWGRLSHHRNPLAPSGQEFTYGYALVSTNQTGRLLSIAAPVPGLTTALSYLENAGNHRLQEIWNKKGTDTLSKFNYQFDSAGRIRKWLQQVASGTPQALTNYYDREGQLLDQVIAPQDGAPAKGYSYAYDAAGNRTAEQIDTLDNTWSSIVSSATYNDLNQLTGISGSGTLPVRFAGWIDEPGTVTVTSSGTTVPAQMTWDEDGPSGRTRFSATLTLASGTQDATITATDRNNPGNQQAQNYTVQVAGGAAKSFTYDANGNCESMTVAGVTTTYAWDAEDRLVQITKGNQTTKIAYDAFSRWRTIIEKTGAVTNSTKHFLWSGLTLVAESDANNQVTRRFYPEGMQVITGSQTSSYYFTRDHLGSIREVTDSSGAVVARYDYDPYGRRTQISGETDFEFGFTGHYYHAQSGLHLAPFRAYSADLGRWLSRDPIGEAGGLNLYGYVGNDPMNDLDPDGTNPFWRRMLLPALNWLNNTRASQWLGRQMDKGLMRLLDLLKSKPACPPPQVAPQLGQKLEYFLGNATGSAHNIERTRELAQQLQRIGLPDTAGTRQFLVEHLTEVMNNPNNVSLVQQNGRIVKESLLMGPIGGAKLQTVWDASKLITGNIFGGW